MIATPGQMRLRADLYQQLASMTEAGLSVPEAFRTLRKARVFSPCRRTIDTVIERLEEGRTLAEATLSTGRGIPPLDRVLIEAGEQSGRLDACLADLSLYYREKGRALGRMMLYLILPVLMIHAMALIPSFPQFFNGSISFGGYVLAGMRILVPLYLAALLLLWLARGGFGSSMGRLLESFVHRVPVLGSALRHLSLSRFSLALGSLLSAGVPTARSWEMAGVAAGSSWIRTRTGKVACGIDDGYTPGECLARSRDFPDLYVGLYCTGEESGRIDRNLQHLHRHYQEEGYRLLATFATWLPRLVYLLVVIWMVYHVFTFWTGHYEGILDATDY